MPVSSGRSRDPPERPRVDRERIGVRYARQPRINGAPGRCGGRGHESRAREQALAGV